MENRVWEKAKLLKKKIQLTFVVQISQENQQPSIEKFHLLKGLMQFIIAY
jgi:hypothetical protein